MNRAPPRRSMIEKAGRASRVDCAPTGIPVGVTLEPAAPADLQLHAEG